MADWLDRLVDQLLWGLAGYAVLAVVLAVVGVVGAALIERRR